MNSHTTQGAFTLLQPNADHARVMTTAAFICEDHGEDRHLQALNLGHVKVSGNVPAGGPLLGIKWLRALHQLITDDAENCFPEAWRAHSFHLAGTSFLNRRGDIAYIVFDYTSEGWRHSLKPKKECGLSCLIFAGQPRE